jgi:hypothetical protein
MPWPDRSIEEWFVELGEDIGLINFHIRRALLGLDGDPDEDPTTSFAVAVKESRRMTSDLYRMAEKAGISREDIDAVRL